MGVFGGVFGGVQSGASAMIPSDNIRGAYNVKRGLDRLRRSIGLVNQRSNGTGEGGLDWLMVGDSLFRGMAGATTQHDSVSAILRNMLQQTFNPPGVLGGCGTRAWRTGALSLVSNLPAWSAVSRVPLLAATTATGTNGTTAISVGSSAGIQALIDAGYTTVYFATTGVYRTMASASGGVINVNQAVTTTNGESVQVVSPEGVGSYTGVWSVASGAAVSRLRSTAADSASNQVRNLHLNTVAPSRRPFLTSVDFLYGTETGGGTVTFDAKKTTTDAAFTAGTGDGDTDTASCNAASSGGNRKTLDGLSADQSYMLQASAPASGTVYVEGYCGFFGDESCGIRGHDLCRVGMSSADNWNAATLAATYDGFCANTGRATNGRLAILNTMTNDIALGTSIAQFKINQAAHLDRIGVTNPMACIYCIPWLSNSAYLASSPSWLDYRDAIYQIISERLDWVMPLDFYELQGLPTTTTAFQAYPYDWIDENASLHNTSNGNYQIAKMIYAVIMEAING